MARLELPAMVRVIHPLELASACASGTRVAMQFYLLLSTISNTAAAEPA